MKIIVGCPTRNRTWILEKWREHVEQAVPGNWDLEYAFVIGDNDRRTIEMLEGWKRTTLIYVTEPEIPDARSWGDGTRYEHMVFLRNALLSEVRKESPDLFLSLDSDILLGQDTLRQMYETMQDQKFDAVGGLTWFDPIDPECTNIAKWGNHKKQGLKRIKNPGTHAVDIIMGIKLMSPAAYNVDYEFHRSGEDLGWNKRVQEAGLSIGCDGRTPSKHVMSPEWLDRKDKRLER